MTICRIAARPSARYHPPFLLEVAVKVDWESFWSLYEEYKASRGIQSVHFYAPGGALVRRCRKRMKHPDNKTIPVWIMADVCISSRRSLKRAMDELAHMVCW